MLSHTERRFLNGICVLAWDSVLIELVITHQSKPIEFSEFQPQKQIDAITLVSVVNWRSIILMQKLKCLANYQKFQLQCNLFTGDTFEMVLLDLGSFLVYRIGSFWKWHLETPVIVVFLQYKNTVFYAYNSSFLQNAEKWLPLVHLGCHLLGCVDLTYLIMLNLDSLNFFYFLFSNSLKQMITSQLNQLASEPWHNLLQIFSCLIFRENMHQPLNAWLQVSLILDFNFAVT